MAVSAVDQQPDVCLTEASHDVAPRPNFDKTFDRVYTLSNGGFCSPTVNTQEIALVFIIMAQGTMYNIEMPTFDSSADGWLRLAELALVKGNFLSTNTIPGLQTLVSHKTHPPSRSIANNSEHLMAHMHLCVASSRPLSIANVLARESDKGRRGDSAWPLWGMVMRLVQAVCAF